MATATLPTFTLSTDWTVADLQRHLGGIPLERIRIYPPPGMATEADLLAVGDHKDRLCELIDGILVEKTMGNFESAVAAVLMYHLSHFVREHKLGLVLAPDGLFRLLPAQIRMPDVGFIRSGRLPPRPAPIPAIFETPPDLAVEILSSSNTRQEMQRKLEEYFQAGTELVWYIDPATRSANVFTAVDQYEEFDDSGTLDGQSVLPGFSLSLKTLFDEADPRGTESCE